MDRIEEAIQRAIDTKSQLYNRKLSCPDDERDKELRFLYKLAEIAPDGAAAEIGVRSGGSLLCWCMARQGRGDLYAVDDWSSKQKEVFYTNLKRYNVDVDIYGMKSTQAAQMIPVEFAFVFIDADHGAPIFDDIREWTPKIMENGIIAFHDYGVWKPTVQVKRAVDEWHKGAGWLRIGLVGSTIAYRKPNGNNRAE